MISKGLLAKFEIQHGKEEVLAAFLQSELPIVKEEYAAIAWSAISFGRSKYVLLDILPDKDADELN